LFVFVELHKPKIFFLAGFYILLDIWSGQPEAVMAGFRRTKAAAAGINRGIFTELAHFFSNFFIIKTRVLPQKYRKNHYF
jgi:hypothetical protein